MTGQDVYALDDFARDFELLASEGDTSLTLEMGQASLKKLLSNKEFAKDLLAQMLSAELPPEQLFRTVDNHGFLLYRSPHGSFSLRLYVWEPGSRRHVIHDHGSWGVIGAYVNDLLIIHYQREDDGSVEGYARLVEMRRRILKPGETSSVLPFNEGIHWTGNCNDSLAMSIHAYGRALRRGYIHAFDMRNDSVYMICTPRLEKSILAAKALGVLGGEISKAALERGLASSYPTIRWESTMSLVRLEPGLGPKLIERASRDESPEVRVRARAQLGKLKSPIPRREQEAT